MQDIHQCGYKIGSFQGYLDVVGLHWYANMLRQHSPNHMTTEPAFIHALDVGGKEKGIIIPPLIPSIAK